MNREAFNRIKEFSAQRKLSKLQERILFHKYHEDYFMLVDDYKSNNNNNEPSADTIIGFNNTLLSDMTLSTNINLSADELKQYTDNAIKKVRTANGWKEFGMSTLSSIVGSFIFTFLIITLFLMGESQIKSWFNDFGKEKENIENSVDKDLKTDANNS
ncbi:hypothetical protein [Flammeovirga agarivorans]|uniref:Uncharacterized protein n=1 Tax=Flammeovirga agarivorans TaxID=2726742 RepID=A0A7X8SK91_9BACT|nr:hypothetical protein [Flammeovirga agarivorans]NLR91677.1 hypothetical protein [Flammeovirga agarivorans]